MNWIKLRPIGEQDKPIPTVWITTSQLKVHEQGLNEVVVLTPREYGAVSALSHKLTCSKTSDEFPNFGTVEVSESVDEHNHVLCVLQRDCACHYLSKILALPDINSESNRLGPINNLSRRLGCKDVEFNAH